jgi:hypothetical protein
MLYTSIDLAIKQDACRASIDKWINSLKPGESYNPFKLVPLTDVLRVLGLFDCLWAVRATTDDKAAQAVATEFSLKCYKRMLDICNVDAQFHTVLEIAYRYLNDPDNNWEVISLLLDRYQNEISNQLDLLNLYWASIGLLRIALGSLFYHVKEISYSTARYIAEYQTGKYYYNFDHEIMWQEKMLRELLEKEE